MVCPMPEGGASGRLAPRQAAQLPVNTGVRFSRNAATASL